MTTLKANVRRGPDFDPREALAVNALLETLPPMSELAYRMALRAKFSRASGSAWEGRYRKLYAQLIHTTDDLKTVMKLADRITL